VEWFVDGEPAAMGETTTLFVPVGGNHAVYLAVTTEVAASDACDPSPKTDVEITLIYKAENGEVIRIKNQAGKLKLKADALKLDGVAEDAAGHTGRDSTVLTIIGGLGDDN